MIERAGIWLRVSTTGQDETSQRPDVARWTSDHEYDVTAEYVLHGKSAYKGNKKFDAMWRAVLGDFREHKIAVLVVWRDDRLDRKLRLYDMIREVVALGGRIEFVTQPHLNKLSDMGSRISLHVQSEISHAESETKSERIRIKHDALRAAGSLVGRQPWGFEIIAADGRKLLAPTGLGREYVPQIFRRITQGDSLRTVAAWLDSEAVPTDKGGNWHERFVAAMIRNPVYYGERRNGGMLEVPALVSATEWQAAGAALAARVRRGRSTTVTVKPLAQPFCGECWHDERDGCASGRSPMYQLHARDHRYLRCTGHGPQRKGCGAPMISVPDFEAALTRAMLADDRPHEDRVFVPGDTRADEIARLQERMALAARAGDMGAVTALVAEITGLQSLPSVAPRWESVVTDQTEAGYFGSLDDAGRREYLARHVVIARRDDSGSVVVTVWSKTDSSEPIRVTHADGSVGMMRSVGEMVRTEALRQRAASGG